MIAINYKPVNQYRLTELCKEHDVSINIGLRIIDDYMKQIDQTKFTKFEVDNMVVYNCNETSNQRWFQLNYVTFVGGQLRVTDVLFSGNVKNDLIEQFKLLKNE